MSGWIMTIVVGALCGWLASKIMKTDAQQGAVANILIGIAGAALAQGLFGNMLNLGGADTAGTALDFWPVVWGVVGSSLLIALLKMVGVLR